MVRIGAALCALVICATAVRADDGTRQNFWESLIAPNEAEVQLILRKARELRGKAFSQWYPLPDLGAENAYTQSQRANRTSLLREAYGMLAYAHRMLSPNHPDLLLEFGRTADDLARRAHATDALQAYLNVAPAGDVGRVDARLRLGRMHARRGEWDDAVRSFELAVADAPYSYAPQATMYLGCAYMHVGRLEDAIEVLSRGSVAGPGLGTFQTHSVSFALVVAYDRDEQITEAYEVLASIITTDPQLGSVFGHRYGHPLSGTPEPLLLPTVERHYFAALRYEATGRILDARDEWSSYVRGATDSPYRDRARAHITEIDAMLDERMKTAGKPSETGAPDPQSRIRP